MSDLLKTSSLSPVLIISRYLTMVKLYLLALLCLFLCIDNVPGEDLIISILRENTFGLEIDDKELNFIV